MRFGIVVGLAAEARLARGLGGEIAVGGGGSAGAFSAATRLVANGVDGLISFGLAGGLSPGLIAGAVVVPEGVVAASGARWLTDAALAARLGQPFGWVLAAPDILVTRAAKRQAWDRSGALAVDLESGAVAKVAADHGLPFAVLRTVCDPADRDLPPAAITALDAAGRIRPAALAYSLLRHPRQLPGLIALGREAGLARAALLAQVAAVGRIG